MWKYYLYFIILVRSINCLCQCKKSHSHHHGQLDITNQTDLLIEKRQLEFEDYSTTEFILDNMTDVSTIFETTTFNENNTDINDTNTEANYSDVREIVLEATETSIDLDEDSTTVVNESTTEEIEQRVIKKIKYSNRYLAKKCRRFKKGTAFDLEKMADVWQVVYYRLPNKLKCFKLHIRLMKSKEQQKLSKIYGNFNNTVSWEKCNLEIKSSDKSITEARRHFLQGTESERGVMENIIIDEEHCQNTTYLTLHRESADQWLVIKNLLVMRDCDTGDIVVFTRVPLEPRRDDILDALMIFGENKANGTMACQEKAEKMWLKYEENNISQPLL